MNSSTTLNSIKKKISRLSEHLRFYSPLWQQLLILIVGIAVYSNALHGEFVFDDDSSISENLLINNLSNFHEKIMLYNPRYVVLLSFAINYALGGLDVTGFHAANIAIHLLSAIMVYHLIRTILVTPLFANLSSTECADNYKQYQLLPVMVALLFVVHPVQTQAVSYIAQRYTSLATFFYLAACICYLKIRLIDYRDDDRNYLFAYGGLILASVLAMKSKEIAFTLPAVFVALEMFFPGEKSLWLRMRLIIVGAIIALIVPLSLYLTATIQITSSDKLPSLLQETSTIGRIDYLLTQFRVIVTYLRLIVIPINQNLDYDMPIYHTLMDPPVAASALFLLVIVMSAVYLYRKGKVSLNPDYLLISFGVAWFFIALVVESSIIPIRDVIFEHRLYLPSVGIFLVLAVFSKAGIQKLCKELGCFETGNIVMSCMFIPLIVLLGMATYNRNHVWRTTLAMWQDVTAKSPNKARGHNNLAVSLFSGEQKDYTRSMEEVETALRLDPKYAEALKNKAHLHRLAGRMDEASKELELASKLDPSQTPFNFEQGNIFLEKGKLVEAESAFKKQIALRPSHLPSYLNLGIVYSKLKRFDEAEKTFSRVITMQPNASQAHNDLGIVLWELKRYQEAYQHFEKACKLSPSNKDYLENFSKASNALYNRLRTNDQLLIKPEK